MSSLGFFNYAVVLQEFVGINSNRVIFTPLTANWSTYSRKHILKKASEINSLDNYEVSS